MALQFGYYSGLLFRRNRTPTNHASGCPVARDSLEIVFAVVYRIAMAPFPIIAIKYKRAIEVAYQRARPARREMNGGRMREMQRPVGDDFTRYRLVSQVKDKSGDEYGDEPAHDVQRCGAQELKWTYVSVMAGILLRACEQRWCEYDFAKAKAKRRTSTRTLIQLMTSNTIKVLRHKLVLSIRSRCGPTLT